MPPRSGWIITGRIQKKHLTILRVGNHALLPGPRQQGAGGTNGRPGPGVSGERHQRSQTPDPENPIRPPDIVFQFHPQQPDPGFPEPL
jgi:hypothetical protein